VGYEVKNNNDISLFSLIFNDSVAVFKAEDIANAGLNDQSGFAKDKKTNNSYGNYRFLNAVFHVQDSLHNFHWELSDDTAMILGQLCFAAKTRFRGRDYHAYYTPSIATQEGPWKFGGLPGLILHVRSADNYVEWKAIKIIQNYAGKIEPEDRSKYKVYNWEEFLLKYRSTVEKYIKLVRSNGSLSAGNTAAIKITSVEIFYPELQTGKGIEF
jgi:GLPGLI family protein